MYSLGETFENKKFVGLQTTVTTVSQKVLGLNILYIEIQYLIIYQYNVSIIDNIIQKNIYYIFYYQQFLFENIFYHGLML